ncbi:MAG: membrane protein insertase YidC [Proteobacteria bacterium]|nr:membrane protein insertase YidC [Pseudomonadota bacterium]MDE3208075.1 membrane protein insertase YidC [Pseudomonadota bacterium]
MDTRRLILLMVMSFGIILLWQNWQGANPQHNAAESAQHSSSTVNQNAPIAGSGLPTGPFEHGQSVIVTTDLFSAKISTVGGDIRGLTLLQQREPGHSQKPLKLFETSPIPYVAQSGLLGPQMPTHLQVYTADVSNVTMQPGQQAVSLILHYHAADGMVVDKVFTFHRDSYIVNIAYRIVNHSNQAVQATPYFQFLRTDAKTPNQSAVIHSYTGPVLYTNASKLKKIDFSSIAKGSHDYPHTSQDGWIAMEQHYFVSAWLPPAGLERRFYTREIESHLFAVGVMLPTVTVAPGQDQKISTDLFAGPKDERILAKAAPGLPLTIDYGKLAIFAKPIFWLLSYIHRIVNNWGFSIIILTLLIKIVFYPLSAKSYRSMAQMRVLGPRLQRIKEQYGKDKQKLHHEIMELYKREKVNPLGGCLPVVIQIPVFLSLYWVLISSFELRGAPFIFWIHDLSVKDPYYVLPIIMGITMFIQTKINPKPVDPVQEKVMLFMPLAMTIFFMFFPAGLVLYWLVNNIVSITQQWYINQSVNRAGSSTGDS